MVLALFDTFIHSLISHHHHGHGRCNSNSNDHDDDDLQATTMRMEEELISRTQEPLDSTEHESDFGGDDHDHAACTSSNNSVDGSLSSSSYLTENFQSLLDSFTASEQLNNNNNKTTDSAAEDTSLSFESLASSSNDDDSASNFSSSIQHELGQAANSSSSFVLSDTQKAFLFRIFDVLGAHHLSSNQMFWQLMLQKLGLHALLSSTEQRPEANDVELTNFFAKLQQLLSCLSSVEAETNRLLLPESTSIQLGNYEFDSRFLLGLSFAIYECSSTLANLMISAGFIVGQVNIECVWSLLLANYVVPFLSAAVIEPLRTENGQDDAEKGQASAIGSGRLLLERLKQTLESIEHDEIETLQFLELYRLHFGANTTADVEPWSPVQSQPFDISNCIWPPECPDDRYICDPLTRSYQCLLSNLKHLRTITYDPFSSPSVQEAFENGRVTASIQMMACMSISYYTMGYFDVRTTLFESLNQHIYDRRSAYDEFCQIFNKHEKSGQRRHQAQRFKQPAAATKWTTVVKSNSPPLIKSPGQKAEFNMLEDIVNRISSLRTCSKPHQAEFMRSSVHESNNKNAAVISKPVEWGFAKLNNNELTPQSDEKTAKPGLAKQPSNRYRTVAPKLLTTNTTLVDNRSNQLANTACGPRSKRVGSSCSFSDEFTLPSCKATKPSMPATINESNGNSHNHSHSHRHRRRVDSFNYEWSGQSEASSSLSSAGYYYSSTQPTPIGAKLASMQSSSSYLSNQSSRYNTTAPGSIRHHGGYESPSFNNPLMTPRSPPTVSSSYHQQSSKRAALPFYYNTPNFQYSAGYYYQDPHAAATYHLEEYSRNSRNSQRYHQPPQTTQTSPPIKWQPPQQQSPTTGYYAKHATQPRFSARPTTDNSFRNQRFYR